MDTSGIYKLDGNMMTDGLVSINQKGNYIYTNTHMYKSNYKFSASPGRQLAGDCGSTT